MNIPQKTFSHGAKRSRGREFIRSDGTRYYINHYPRFSVQYYAEKDPEEILYREWEDEIVIYGRKLLKLYEEFKANARDHLQETEGPYDPDSDQPFIQTIKHRMQL